MILVFRNFICIRSEKMDATGNYDVKSTFEVMENFLKRAKTSAQRWTLLQSVDVNDSFGDVMADLSEKVFLLVLKANFYF